MKINKILNNKYRWLPVFIFLFTMRSLSAYCQEDIDVTYHRASEPPKQGKDKSYLENISVGGNVGLAIGNYILLALKPEAAYHFLKDWMAAGVGVNYTLVYEANTKISNHTFGGKIFAEAHIFNYVGIRAEYEIVNFENYILNTHNQWVNERQWSNIFRVGGGFYRKFERIATYGYLLYSFADNSQFTGLNYAVGIHVFLR
ncbi:MAG: hypothetical protein LBR36_06570 [Bacteroidales bacterium]|jgi:hypothetical protein|nr:hypothetical protein [Bacteroidales bacterium]